MALGTGKDAGLKGAVRRHVDDIFHKEGTSHAKVSGKDKSHGHRGSEQTPERLGK